MRRTLVRYGRHRANVVELWLPPSVAGDVPVVALLHGGFWKAPYTKRLMRGLARAVTDEGWAAWNIEYRRVGRFGGGGGWPTTLADVGAALDALTRVPGVDLDRIVTCGHSAGGQLALWAAGRHQLPAGAPGAGPQVRVTGAVALAGVVDLVEAARLGLGDGAVARFLGGEPDVHPERYAVTSPAALVPLGVRQVLVHGRDDETVPLAMSEHYSAAAIAAGDTDATCIPVDGVGHMGVIRPRSAAWPAVRDSLRSLLP